MRKLALALALCLSLAAPPAASAATKRTCALKGSETVAKNKYARVFTLPSRRGDERERLYGCLHSVGRRVLLDVSSSDDYVTEEEFTDVALKGRFVTWRHVSTDISCKADCPPGYNPVSDRTMVANLKTRRIRVRD